MAFSLVNNSGSGNIQGTAIATYSYSEDVTSLEPSNLTGGTGQVTVSAIAVDDNTVGNTHPNSKLLVNNTMTLTDDSHGSIEFQVKQATVSNGIVSLVGDTIMSRLNIITKSGPYGGLSGATLLGAIEEYCLLAGVIPVISEEFQAKLNSVPVNFIGWSGNLWEHIKMLCAAMSASTTTDVGIEAYVSGNQLHFREAKTSVVDYGDSISDYSVSINTFEAAKEVEVFNYNTQYKVDGIVQEQNRSTYLYGINANVSITDNMQVDAGSTLTKRFKINASLESVKQPDCVSAIIPLPYAGSQGQYVIVGNDDVPVSPEQWKGQGGSLTVTLTDEPDEIEITIVAPPSLTMQTADNPAEVTLAPYKVGVESSGSEDYPALYIVGTGVFFNKTSETYPTGASEVYTAQSSAPSIDNPFIINKFTQNSRGIAAAQVVCGPTVTLSQTIAGSGSFGDVPGKIQVIENNRYRTINASYGPNSTGINAVACSSVADFNSLWSTKTFAQFTTTVFDGTSNPTNALRFNEFTIIPLIGS